MTITIPDAVRQMLAIVDKLCTAYPKKKFTLDSITTRRVPTVGWYRSRRR